jgi:hypothetical protein
MRTVIGKALNKFLFLLTMQKSKYIRNNMSRSEVHLLDLPRDATVTIIHRSTVTDSPVRNDNRYGPVTVLTITGMNR